MDKYNFVPDYAAWWKKRDLSKEQLLWLALGINPDDVVQERDRKEHPEKYDDSSKWLAEFRYYVECLPNLGVGEVHRNLMKYMRDSKSKADFISNLYDFKFQFPQCFQEFINSQKSLKIPTTYDVYKNHDQYLSHIENIDSISSEVTAFATLLGLDGHFFERFCTIGERTKDEALIWYADLTPDERHFTREYTIFLRKGFSVDIPYYYISEWKKLRGKNIWQGDFKKYAQTLHDEGYVFSQKTYAFLKDKGVNLSYSEGGWAWNFYKSWIDRGVWTLKEAIALYQGADPHGGREFIGMSANDSEEKGQGYLLHSSEFIIPLDENGEMKKFRNGNFYEETSPEAFIDRHIKAGHIQSVGTTKSGELQFIPKDITEFFKNYCTKTHQPKALFQVLGINDDVVAISGTAKTHTGMAGRPTAKHLILAELSKKIIQGNLEDKISREAEKLREWFVLNHPDISLPTKRSIENQIRSEYNKAKCTK